MDPERYRKTRAIVRAALDLEPSQRLTLLATECGADASLRESVEEWLARLTSAPTVHEGSLVALPALAPGSLVAGRYRIESEIGAGGMGRVFRATQLALGREVALKVLSSGPDASPSALRRLEREAAAVARLRHPNIVTIYDAGTEPGVGAFFAMELVRGRSLADELKLRGSLPFAEAAGLVRQIAEAVGAAHEAGIIHRDLKPGNVMLEGSGEDVSVRVLDFGIAKLVGDLSELGSESLTAAGAILGTPLYMSPEQLCAMPVDARSDVWSLGVILYELVAGTRPFVGSTVPATFAAIMKDEPEPLDRVAPGIPAALAGLAARTLAKEPSSRPATARELAAELAGLARTLVTVADEALLETGAPVAPHPTNIPAEQEPLIGREAELRDLVDLFRQDGARLVTLTGPGGGGKTSLARAAARQLLPAFEDGVYFVDLSAVATPALVIPTIARELGVREEGTAPAADLLAVRLHAARLLLVLDNFEHLLDAAPAVDELFRRSPRVRVLVTSRSPLRVRAEVVRVVAPLAVPDAGAGLAVEELERCAAVALFVERARAVKPGFALTERNAEDVAAICRELDGLPLALELAAARLKLLTPASLLARLGERLRLLTDGGHDHTDRRRTMRDAIAWSYDLLDDDARAVFERLAVFAGGWRLVQAEAVAGRIGGRQTDVILALEELVEGSLVVMTEEADGEVRFRMLSVVREFALERLAARDAVEETARAHAEAYRDFAQEAVGYLTGERMAEWLVRLEQEHDNIRAALAWSLERDPETCLQLAGATGNLWAMHCHYAEGRKWLDDALRHGAGVAPAVRAKVLRRAGNLARHQGDLAAARGYVEESLKVSEETGDPLQIAWACVGMGHILQDFGDIPGARAIMERGLTLAREAGVDRLAANALNDLGEMAFIEGDYAAARAFYEEARENFRRSGDQDGIATSAANLAHVALSESDPDAADALLREALEIHLALGAKHDALADLDSFAAVAAARGEWERAAKLSAAVEAQRGSIGFAWDLPRRLFHDSYIATLSAAGAGADLEASAERGRGLTLDAAVALALGA